MVLLLICEIILDGGILRQFELPSDRLDNDADLLGMVPSDPDPSEVDEKHLNAATRSLTLTLGGVAWFIEKLERLDSTLDVFYQFNHRCRSYLPSDAKSQDCDAEFAQRMVALRSRITGYKAHATRMQLQGQAMVQTVHSSILITNSALVAKSSNLHMDTIKVFCLIGTNNNRLN